MRKQTYLLISIILISFLVRLYRIDNPIADWHSWRQADTAAVTRNFIKLGFTPLVPRFDDLSNVASGIDNPEGYRMVEFPVYNILSYLMIVIFGSLGGTIEMWMRLTSVFLSIGSLVFIYLMGKTYANMRVGLYASFFFGVLPYSVYYSRVVLPEPALVFFSLGMMWFFGRWAEISFKLRVRSYELLRKKYLYYVLALMFGICALLIKPMAGFLFIPMVYMWYRKKDFSFTSLVLTGGYFVLVLIPLYWWREWIQQFPAGIPAWEWLLNGNNIRFKPSFFRWILWERLTKLILGYAGVVFLLSGLAGVGESLKTKSRSRGWFFIWWVVAISLYVTVFATGNVQHDYYQVITIPIVTLCMGYGVDAILRHRHARRISWGVALGLAVVAFTMVWYSWKTIGGYYWINNPALIEAGQAADRILPEDAKVIAPLGGDTAFLYQTNRHGWPVGISIEEMRGKGATHYVNVNMTDAEVDYVREAFTVIEETDDYIIAKLEPKDSVK